MTQVKLVRRWGSHPAGETVDVDEGQWLVDIGFAVRPGQEDRNRHGGSGRVHPGTDGPDPRAGGDPSRLRMTAEVKSPRGGERAGRVAGAPRAAGDVTHVADENLAGPNRKNRNDVPLASGKLLTEDLAEQQRQLEKRESERKTEKSDQGEGSEAKSESGLQASGQSPQAAGEQPGRVLSQPKRN